MMFNLTYNFDEFALATSIKLKMIGVDLFSNGNGYEIVGKVGSRVKNYPKLAKKIKISFYEGENRKCYSYSNQCINYNLLFSFNNLIRFKKQIVPRMKFYKFYPHYY